MYSERGAWIHGNHNDAGTAGGRKGTRRFGS